MNKKISEDRVVYSIAWSEARKHEKYDALKFLPELPGIISIYEKSESGIRQLLYYACWRDGLRVGLRKLMDPLYTAHKDILDSLEEYPELYYRYTVIDSSPADLKDILSWLIRSSGADLNSSDFMDSGRYLRIAVEERQSDHLSAH